MSRPIQIKINPEGNEKWINSNGKSILNFSAIELQSYWWIGKFKKIKGLHSIEITLYLRKEFFRKI